MENQRKYGQLFEAAKGEDVQTAVLQNEKVVLDFTAKWCGPCKQLEPVLNQYASENDNILFLKIDVDNQEFQELMEISEVKNLPTLQFYHNKEMIGDIVGLQKDSIIDYLNTLINK